MADRALLLAGAARGIALAHADAHRRVQGVGASFRGPREAGARGDERMVCAGGILHHRSAGPHLSRAPRDSRGELDLLGR